LDEYSYILRVYRFDDEKPEQMVGTLLAPESLEQYRFSGPFELWEAIKELRKEKHTRVNFVLLEGPWENSP